MIVPHSQSFNFLGFIHLKTLKIDPNKVPDSVVSLVNDIQNDAPEPTKTIADYFNEALVPQGIEIPKPVTIFEIEGVPVFTKKSLSTLKGKAKSGKTTATAWFVSQTIKNDMTALWIDTEQGLYYASRTQHWVLSIAGMPTCDRLKMYDLKIHKPNVRSQIIELAIQEFEPDIVIVDGIRDLVFDINSPEEATNTAGDLMKWAEIYDCHILSIIHENKDNGNARGHIGSEMINKSETVIRVELKGGITVCEPEFSRGEPFGAFAFDRDDHGLPVIIGNYKVSSSSHESNAKKVLPIDIPSTEHNEYLSQVFKHDDELSYNDLLHGISAVFEQYGITMGINRTKNFIQFYIQHSYIKKMEKRSNKTYYSYANV